jgi:hypothetical protein
MRSQILVSRQIFERYFPLYALSDSLDHHAQATQTLYGRWKERVRQLELIAKKEEIEAKLDPEKTKSITPYGG